MDERTGGEAHALAEALATVTDGGTFTLPDGDQLVVTKNPRSGVDLEASGGPNGSVSMVTAYAAAEVRPQLYPPRAPFIPNAAVIVTAPGGDSVFLNWPNVVDGDGLIEQIRVQLRDAGWEEIGEPAEARLRMRALAFRSGGLDCRLLLDRQADRAVVQLIQFPGPES